MYIYVYASDLSVLNESPWRLCSLVRFFDDNDGHFDIKPYIILQELVNICNPNFNQHSAVFVSLDFCNFNLTVVFPQ